MNISPFCTEENARLYWPTKGPNSVYHGKFLCAFLNPHLVEIELECYCVEKNKEYLPRYGFPHDFESLQHSYWKSLSPQSIYICEKYWHNSFKHFCDMMKQPKEKWDDKSRILQEVLLNAPPLSKDVIVFHGRGKYEETFFENNINNNSFPSKKIDPINLPILPTAYTLWGALQFAHDELWSIIVPQGTPVLWRSNLRFEFEVETTVVLPAQGSLEVFAMTYIDIPTPHPFRCAELDRVKRYNVIYAKFVLHK